MRLDKFLKECNVCSRSESKQILKKGLIKVNDKIIKDSSYKLDENKDVVTYNDKVIEYQEFVYIMLNKPSGVVSATTDSKDTTVIDLVSEYAYKELFPFGRLDKDSVGLLILSNDGKLAHELLSPKKHVSKVYYLKIKGRLDESDVKAFKEGITLEDGYVTKEGELEIIKSDEISECYATISEGKFHQLKRMFIALNKEVVFLKRIKFKDIVLDESLNEGEYRLLTNEEIESLKAI
ncbi:MAG: rRNA pseudouridine synthase [Bacilli bacterium]|nr:rRNA pseudouridine synthase [Bacilli bacterium]